jgi:hypothetical protein
MGAIAERKEKAVLDVSMVNLRHRNEQMARRRAGNRRDGMHCHVFTFSQLIL